jgi:hypothetical protein
VGFRLTVRTGPKVKRYAFEDVQDALTALEAEGRQLARDAPEKAVDAKVLRFEASERVIARLEVSGPERLVPSIRAGVDVRGDGSVAAYRGRVRRQALESREGESAYAALRRALSER